MIRLVVNIHLAISLLLAVVAGVYGGTHQVLAGLVGSAFMLANLAALMWAWQRIFLKKSIALAVSVIVIKYAILGAFIYFVMTSGRLDPAWFTAGLVTVLPTMTVFALSVKRPTSV